MILSVMTIKLNSQRGGNMYNFYTPNEALLEPRTLLVFGIRKIGKTPVVDALPNSILIDFESGSEHITRKNLINIEKVQAAQDKVRVIDGEFMAFLKEEQKKHNYQFCVIDTVTGLENYGGKHVTDKYNSTEIIEAMKVNPNVKLKPIKSYNDIPYGGGQYKLRNFLSQFTDDLLSIFPRIVFTGHIKEKEVYSGIDQMPKQLALFGKYASIFMSRMAVIAYMYQRDNTRILSMMNGNDSTVAGSRVPRLYGREINISEFDIKTRKVSVMNWEKIYPQTFEKLGLIKKSSK